MNLTWNGREEIAAGKEAVWAFINDPAKIAACLPDVQSTTIRDAHSFESIVGVALGPVRGKFTFKILLVPAPDGNHRLEEPVQGRTIAFSSEVHSTSHEESASKQSSERKHTRSAGG